MEWSPKNHKANPLLSASILGADWLKFGEAIELAEDVGSDLLQIDIADGIFAPTITFGEELVERVRGICDLPIEVHLMVSRPQDWISLLADLGADFLLFHVEAVERVHGTIELVRRHGVGVGVVLNTETNPEVIKYILPYIDIVSLMAILPGFAGQPFIEETYEKIRKIREMIDGCQNDSVLIEVDGGIKRHNVKKVIEAGADIAVVSSAIYRAPAPKDAADELRTQMHWQDNEKLRSKRVKFFLNNIIERRKNKKR